VLDEIKRRARAIEQHSCEGPSLAVSAVEAVPGNKVSRVVISAADQILRGPGVDRHAVLKVAQREGPVEIGADEIAALLEIEWVIFGLFFEKWMCREPG
jgi:hypothetical protein